MRARGAPNGVLRSRLEVAAAAVFAWAMLVQSGCKRRPPPEEIVDGWSLARKALTSGRECFAARPEYCITDPAFVDAAIQPRLDELYGGEMPIRKVNAEAIVRSAVTEYRRATMKPASMARVEELLRERYDNPKITVEGDEVVVDMGVVPGTLGPSPATLSLRLVKSDLVDNGAWKESEARRVLASTAKKYPDKGVVRVAVTIVSARGMEPEALRYLRADKRVVVYLGDEPRTTRPLASEADLGSVPLAFESLDVCKRGEGASPSCPDLPKPPADD